MQLRGPTPHMVNLHLAQRHRLRRGELRQPLERLAVRCERARRETALHFEVDEMAPYVVVGRRLVGHDQTGSRRDKPALASSPMRDRNSVPMSAV